MPLRLDAKHAWLLMLVVPCVAVVLFAFGEHGETRAGAVIDVPAVVAPASESRSAASAPARALPPTVAVVPRAAVTEDDAAGETDATAIEAMVRAGHVGAARTATYEFFKRYPSSARGAALEALTGMHRPPPPPPS